MTERIQSMPSNAKYREGHDRTFARPSHMEMAEDTCLCPLCGMIMVWHDLVIEGEVMVAGPPLGSSPARIRYCMKSKCLLGHDKRHEHLLLWN